MPWVGSGFLGPSSGSIYVEDAKIAQELTLLTLDMWKPKERKALSTDWAEAKAVTCQPTIQKIMGKVAKGDITSYYAEYLDGSRCPNAAFFIQGACFIYDGDGRRTSPRSGILRKLKKHRGTTYIRI